MTWQTVGGILKQGHQVASGRAIASPYEAGTIQLQTPYFLKLGLDLSPYFSGTLNISIAPKQFSILKPTHTFPNLKWHPDFAAETFSFSPCQVEHKNYRCDGLIYYPHPETKLAHFQDSQTLEIIAPFLKNVQYGDRLMLSTRPEEVAIE